RAAHRDKKGSRFARSLVRKNDRDGHHELAHGREPRHEGHCAARARGADGAVGEPRHLRGARRARQGREPRENRPRHRALSGVNFVLFWWYRPSFFPTTPPGTAPPDATGLGAFLQSPYFRTFIPVPIIVALAPVVWWFFRSTWRELDVEAQRHRGAILASGGY